MQAETARSGVNISQSVFTGTPYQQFRIENPGEVTKNG